MLEWIKKGFTATDGSMDDARVSAFLLVLSFIGATLYSIYLGHPWDAKDFGIGAGAMAAGIGGWFGFRKDN